MLRNSLFALLLVVGLAAAADIPIKGGCLVGESQLAHGLSQQEAEARIAHYARVYMQSYLSFSREKTDARRKASEYLELKAWTQDDIVGFTRHQRELLLISVAGELATGQIDAGELPGYVSAIDEKIRDIEVELGCVLAMD